jgi:glycosyltransferase involved in cell wall biosynthesis
MADTNDLVSIIVPAYNAEKYIADAIGSVLRQTYPYFELIIVDDASTDRTAEVVQSFSDQRIKLIRHASNKGPGAARNTAIEAANGKWIAVLDADDQWKANRLERLVEVSLEAGNGYFVADDFMLCFDSVSGLKPWRRGLETALNISYHNDSLILNLCDYIKLGTSPIKPFMPLDHVRQFQLRYYIDCLCGEDLEFLCHLFRTGLKLRLIAEPLYLYRITPDSLTSKPSAHEHLCEVYERLIAEPGFSQEEKLIFKELLAKRKEEIEYAPFPQALKQRNYGEALKLAIKRPTVLLKFLRRLPKSARYRLAAWKSEGKTR